MNFKTGIQIHNKFDIRETNVLTGEEKWYKGKNIVLDRMYTRLCSFNTYFVNIVFGSGTTAPAANKSTLGTRIGYKTAEQHSLARAFPTSIWTKKIRLGANEYNEQYIREVGISDDSTQINTHALITDSEGKSLEVEKTSTKIIDIFATVYITLYDVDWGLAWVDTGFRDYLTGASMASDNLSVSFTGLETFRTTVGSTRTKNETEKWVKISAEFNEQYYNKDIQYIYWINGGLRAAFPRTGKSANHQRTGIAIGQGDGDKTVFTLPNKKVKDLVIKVDGVVVSNYDYDGGNKIIFDVAIDSGKPVTADYKCDYIPKDEDHILKAHFKIQYEASQPIPVMPPKDPIDTSKIPGAIQVIAGTSEFGFFGEVTAQQLISGDDLCEAIGLTTGISQYSDVGWLKYVDDGKIKFVAKKTIRHTVSWNNINDVYAVFGGASVVINGIDYFVRLLSTEEWNKLMYPVHKDHPDGAPDWWDYEDCDLHVHSSCGNGSYSWTSTLSGSTRVIRGNTGVSYSRSNNPSGADYNLGFRPVLEVL